MEKLTGRMPEQKMLREAMETHGPELIALYGRRRVGKTFLIRQYLIQSIVFEFAGTKDANLVTQLNNFKKTLGKAIGNDKIYQEPAKWADAFDQLSHYLTPKLAIEKCVVFLDEFPWLNTHKSGFLPAFDHWWNSWGTKQHNLVVVICGSAASWMIRHVVNNKGGLHNRITRKIRLLPFTLKETEEFLHARNINLDQYQILQLYMVMGGIPHYLKEVKKGESATQAIDRTCFTKDGLLTTEFKNLYHSLFDDATRHLAIVRALAKNNAGMTRTEIIENTNLTSGGTITEILEELIESGFVTDWQPYDKKSKDTIYKLADEFTHFHLKFMANIKSSGKGVWQSFSSGQSWRSWSGVAFERVCLKNIPQLKKELGISGVYTEESAWRHLSANDKGAQIDLLLDRKDMVINLCEMKYSESEFIIDKSYAAALENKRDVFKSQTKTKKSIFLSFVTTFGIKDNEYAKRLIQNSITMNALFR
ncbi:MAG TPA: ATP-binding protein [Saprospiraceae bacterium]|nr:ATP-binding protein [Saprospiraceae bacterium]